MNFWLIFLTGLTTGGFSCAAVQGGLLTSLIANQKAQSPEEVDAAKSTQLVQDWQPLTLFLVSKLISHTALGFMLGMIGSSLELSVPVRITFQTFAALFMLGTALNLLDVHPFFRIFLLQPPRFLRRLIKNQTKSQAFFAPILLGLMTVFIPCGVTQSMEVLAITTGSPINGALLMFWFVLGTFPLFALIGFATAKLSATYATNFFRVAALLLIGLALSSLNGVLVVLNSPITLATLTAPITYFFSDERFATGVGGTGSTAQIQDGVQRVTIRATNDGYAPRNIKVKVGTPVELAVETNETYTCASSFVLKAFNISLQLGPSDRKLARFTPTQPGKYPYSCSMGMYTGTLEVL